MLNRHIIKNFIYIISITIITLIVTSVLINVCAKWSADDPLYYLNDPGNFYEVELCQESMSIVSTSIYVNASILAIIGFLQILYATIYSGKNTFSQKDSRNLAAAGRFLLVISITMVVIMNYAYTNL